MLAQSVILIIVGATCFVTGLVMIVFYVVNSHITYTTNPITAEEWVHLKMNKTPSNDPSSTFSSWKLGVKALPSNLKIYPAHTLMPKQGLPNTFYYKICELVPMADQGNCQSCTLFASYSMLASRLAIRTGSTPEMLSVQQALDCLNLNCDLPLTIDIGLNFASSVGIVQAKSYPYVQKGAGSCLIQNTEKYKTRVFATTIQAVSKPFTVGDSVHKKVIQAAMTEMYRFGPIVTIIELRSDLLYNYTAMAQNPTTKAYVCSIYTPSSHSVSMGYHAILVIGWQKPNPKNYDGACWICISSWGTSWPPSPWASHPGAFFVKMGSNVCGIESQFITAHPVLANT